MTKSGFHTRDDAERALDLVRQKHSRGVAVVDRMTVQAWLEVWIERKRSELKDNSWHGYKGQIDRILIPYLGRYKLDELRPSHIRAAFDAYSTRPGRANTRNGGQTALLRARAVLRSALEDARRDGLIEGNPASGLRMKGTGSKPVVWTPRRVATWARDVERLEAGGLTPRAAWWEAERPGGVLVYTPAQVGQFLDHASEHRLYATFFLMATRGLRRGEACGLQWGDVDWDHGTLTIERQRVKVGRRIVTQTPKSSSGLRTIALGREGVEILRHYRAAQAKERLKRGWGPTDWITTDVHTGEVQEPNKLTTEFRRLCFEAGLPPVRLHDLRHASATIMAASGADLVTMKGVLGHSDIKMSAAYTSLLPDIEQASADAAIAFIPRRARDAQR